MPAEQTPATKEAKAARPMTIEELRAVPGNSLRVNQVAAFLGMNPQ